MELVPWTIRSGWVSHASRCGVSVEVVGGLVGICTSEVSSVFVDRRQGTDADEQGDGGGVLAGLGFDLES